MFFVGPALAGKTAPLTARAAVSGLALAGKAIPLDARVAVSGTGFSREGARSGRQRPMKRHRPPWERACSRMLLIVPTLRVGMHPVTLCVTTHGVSAFGCWSP